MDIQATKKGIWYEKKRDRYRVRLYRDGELLERSYHRSYEAALAAWERAQSASKPNLEKQEAALRRFLYPPKTYSGIGA